MGDKKDVEPSPIFLEARQRNNELCKADALFPVELTPRHHQVGDFSTTNKALSTFSDTEEGSSNLRPSTTMNSTRENSWSVLNPVYLLSPRKNTPYSGKRQRPKIEGSSLSQTENADVSLREKQAKMVFGADEKSVYEFNKYIEGKGSELGAPVLLSRDYGMPGRWSEDIVTLGSNAIRREVLDLYQIMGAIKKSYRSITYGDIIELRQWWYFFQEFWHLYQGIDKKLLFPLIHEPYKISGRLDQFNEKFVTRSCALDWINFKLEEMTAYIHSFGRLPPGNIFALLFKALDELAESMLRFLGE